MVITKKIFQTHQYKYEELPKWFKQTSMSWINLNPGWEYIYHDAATREKYVKDTCPELYKIYGEIRKPHQADIWRYLIVKNEGGVYADMDSFCLVPMDYILDGLPEHIDLVSTKTEARKHTNNANFAAVKNSKVLHSCVDDIIKANSIFLNKPDQQIIHQCFTDGVRNNPDIVSKTMRAGHGRSYKTDFDQNLQRIDYYGQEMTYEEFLSNQNMI